MRTRDDLRQMQALPLHLKVELTKARIRQWVHEYGEDGVYVSFSGGKDSTVLLHIVREMFPSVVAMFVNTGLEYPETVQFVKSFENVDIIRPDMNFKKVIEKYGYPFPSKETAECIYGARRYLKELRDRHTDRQTDRVNCLTHSSTESCSDMANTQNQSGMLAMYTNKKTRMA